MPDGAPTACARIFEFLAGLQQRLLADDAGPADLMHMTARVGNLPVARAGATVSRPLFSIVT